MLWLSPSSGSAFARGCDVLSSARLQHIFGTAYLISRIAMNGKERSAVLNTPFVALCLVFRNAHSDQRADQAAHGTTDAESC